MKEIYDMRLRQIINFFKNNPMKVWKSYRKNNLLSNDISIATTNRHSVLDLLTSKRLAIMFGQE